MKPKIYVFCNQQKCDGRGDWHYGTAIAEDGTGLASHLSSSHAFLIHDLCGASYGGWKGWDRPEYAKHYPDGYEVQFLEGDEAITEVIARLPKPVASPQEQE